MLWSKKYNISPENVVKWSLKWLKIEILDCTCDIQSLDILNFLNWLLTFDLIANKKP